MKCAGRRQSLVSCFSDRVAGRRTVPLCGYHAVIARCCSLSAGRPPVWFRGGKGAPSCTDFSVNLLMPLMPGFLRVKRLMVLGGGPGWLGVSRAACSVLLLLLLLLPSLPCFFFPLPLSWSLSWCPS